MGFLRKTFYTVIGAPALFVAGEHFYTIKCVEVEPSDRMAKYSPLIARRLAEGTVRFDRYERVVPITSVAASIGNVDEVTLSRRLAKQVWLTGIYTPQRKICEKIEGKHRNPNSNLTYEELEKAKIEEKVDVSEHMTCQKIDGTYLQFDPIVPVDVDFKGPGGAVAFEVTRRGENIVFGMEGASIGLKTTGTLAGGDWLQFVLHKMYARLLLTQAVDRVLQGGGE